MLEFEQAASKQGATCIIGCDEAGRGALAGPVVAAAVHINPRNYEKLTEVNDSKQLSEKKRWEFYQLILNYAEVTIGIIEADEIDEINIYEASRKAMLIATSNQAYDYVLTDAMPLPSLHVPVEAIIKGDQKSMSIACASIIAKCTRDAIMLCYDEVYPQYAFSKHKGYGTKVHKASLERCGLIEHVHRKSYKPVADLLVKQEVLF